MCRLAGPLLGVKLRGPWVVLVCGAHGGGGRAGVRGPAGSGWRAGPAAGWQLRGPLVDRFVV